jgi:hypothetical protein
MSSPLPPIPFLSLFKLVRNADEVLLLVEGDKQLRAFLSHVRLCPEADLVHVMPRVFSLCIKNCSASSDLVFLSLSFCCRVLDVCVPNDPLGGEDVLAAEVIPVRKDVEFEPALGKMLVTLKESNPDLSASVGEISFSDWLRGLAAIVVDRGLSVPVSAGAVECVQTLMQISARNVESDVGRICASVLFNTDHVAYEEFFATVVDTYVKLRQVPKLVAKIIMAVDDVKVTELTRVRAFPQ